LPAADDRAVPVVEERRLLLTTLLDDLIPADEFPSAVEAGGLDFLATLLAERPDLQQRVAAVLDLLGPAGGDGSYLSAAPQERAARLTALGDHGDWSWFVDLVQGGYYADPANGGNAGARSWSMIGWDPDPAGGWPQPVPVEEPLRVLVRPEDIAPRYDAVVVGSGAGGGVAACGLAEAGRSVLVLEAGEWPSIAALAQDHLRNPRSDWGLSPRSGPTELADGRVVETSDGDVVVPPSDPRWSNNAETVGGGTRVYGAQAWRFEPTDFAMATTYGVPEGSALADWPLGYADLEPFYSLAEWEVGVSGDGGAADPRAGARSRPYPMPPLPTGRTHERLRRAATTLGLTTVPVPLLINSGSYLGRPGCAQCRMCVGFACPVDAKNGSQNTLLTRAFATGRCGLVTGARVERLLTDDRGRVTGVSVVGRNGQGLWRREVAAAEVVVAAGAVESARLLLNSAHPGEPQGIGNNTDQVGRHLQGHLYGGAVGLFDEEVEELIGPGPSLATTTLRHGNPGLVGGGIIANEFVPTPSNIYRMMSGAGLVPRWGLGAKHGMRDLSRRMLRLMGPVQEVTSASSRVRVEPGVRDSRGIPVARLSGSVHREDVRGRDFLASRSEDWLRAAGAHTVVRMAGPSSGPSGGQHQAGTCRMGTDPATSVVDPFGRVWGHDNLRVADGSVHVTNGGVNPVLTIFATAMRTVDDMVGGWASRPRAVAGAVPTTGP
jgi:choline dehydrogenase-like flavoprotein